MAACKRQLTAVFKRRINLCHVLKALLTLPADHNYNLRDGSFSTACHTSLKIIVILLFECCFAKVIDCFRFIRCIAFYLVSVYNCSLIKVLLQKHPDLLILILPDHAALNTTNSVICVKLSSKVLIYFLASIQLHTKPVVVENTVKCL